MIMYIINNNITIFATKASILWIFDCLIGLFQKSWDVIIIGIRMIANKYSKNGVLLFILKKKYIIDTISNKLV
jgi:hypothetical protein